MTFGRIIFLFLAIFSVYWGVTTPLLSEDGAAFWGNIAGRIFFVVLFVYLAFRKKKDKQ